MIPHTNLMAVSEGLGYRATAPGKAIASLLEQKHDALTVEELREELPSAGWATVFRTIKPLLEAGAVCKLATMDGSQMYSLCRVGHRHHHSVCIECGAVEDSDPPRSSGLSAQSVPKFRESSSTTVSSCTWSVAFAPPTGVGRGLFQPDEVWCLSLHTDTLYHPQFRPQ